LSTLFAEYVDSEPLMCDQLPLIHTSQYRHFHSLAASHQLVPSQCGHFKEPLLYLFYGRPGYRPQTGIDPTSDFSLCPITFIFKPHRFPATVKRAFPFDTGAACNGLYSPHCEVAQVDDFNLTQSIEAVQKLVKRFFGSNGSYFAGNLQALTVAGPNTVDRYVDLVRDPAKAADDRRYSIEVQIEEPIDLKSSLVAVVLPASFLSDAQVLTLVRQDWGALPLVYETYLGGCPRAYYQSVLDKVRAFYREHRWIEP